MSRAVHALLFLSLALMACGRDRFVREWRAEDHAPPPSDPEGQAGREEAAEPGTGPEMSPEDAERSAALQLFQMSCASCHGRTGAGDGPSRPPAGQIPNFTDPAWQASRSDEQLAQVIVQGRGMMPAFGNQISAEGIAALVRHVRTLAPEP